MGIKDAYAQKQRDTAYGVVPKPLKGTSLPEMIRARQDEMEQAIMERRMRDKMRMLEEEASKAVAEVAKITSASGDLDLQMAQYMRLEHGIEVVKEFDVANMRGLYRFIDPATGDYYNIDVDERMPLGWQDEIDHKQAMMDAAMDYFVEKRKKAVVEDALRYTDAEGRTFVKKVDEEPKAPIHREGHFPTHWVEEALDRAEASEKCITLSMERKGVMVVAMEGEDKYSSHVITWEMMEKSEINPLPLAIADVEKKLDMLGKIKAEVAKTGGLVV